MDEKYENSNGSETPIGLTRTRSRRFHTKALKDGGSSGSSSKKDSLDLETGSKPMTPNPSSGSATGSSSSSSRFGFFASDKYRTLTPIRRHKTPSSANISKDADSGRPSAVFGKSSRRSTQSPQPGLGGMTIGAPSGANAAGLGGSSHLQPTFEDDDGEGLELPLFSPRTFSRIQRPEDSIFRNSIGFNTDVSISQYWNKAIGIDSPSKNLRLSKRLDSRSLKYFLILFIYFFNYFIFNKIIIFI